MNEETPEEFNERFATIEETLKYLADSQAKFEFISRQASARHDKEIAELREMQKQTQRHLEHITKVLRFNIEEYEFQEEKLQEAGKILSRKRKK